MAHPYSFNVVHVCFGLTLEVHMMAPRVAEVGHVLAPPEWLGQAPTIAA
jgi:hypothetical protein